MAHSKLGGNYLIKKQLIIFTHFMKMDTERGELKQKASNIFPENSALTA